MEGQGLVRSAGHASVWSVGGEEVFGALATLLFGVLGEKRWSFQIFSPVDQEGKLRPVESVLVLCVYFFLLLIYEIS